MTGRMRRKRKTEGWREGEGRMKVEMDRWMDARMERTGSTDVMSKARGEECDEWMDG